MLVAALNLIAVHGGLVSVAQGSVFAMGAYVAAVLGTSGTWTFAMHVAVAVGAGALLGVCIGWLTGRLSPDGFLLVTFGVQVIASAVILNWTEVTRGAMGISDIDGFRPAGRAATITYVGIATAVALGLIRQIERSPFGRVLAAIRDSEIFAVSLGKNVTAVRVSAVGASFAVTSCAGAVYAHWQRYVSPDSFTLEKSILILSMLIFGGGGSIFRHLFGAATLLILPEIARLIVGGPAAANMQGVLYGVVLVVVVVARPRGFWAGRPE
jgi:branched-chain amino acid transport system permease protein